MKIIRQGVLPGTRTHRGTCLHCETVFEFTENEARHSSDQRDGNALIIDCPLCKNGVWINPDARRANQTGVVLP